MPDSWGHRQKRLERKIFQLQLRLNLASNSVQHTVTNIKTSSIFFLEDRLKKPTRYLQDWLLWVNHQIKASTFLANTRPPGQLTIQQAFANAIRQRNLAHDYPPWGTIPLAVLIDCLATPTYPYTWIVSGLEKQECVKNVFYLFNNGHSGFSFYDN